MNAIIPAATLRKYKAAQLIKKPTEDLKWNIKNFWLT